MLQVKRKGIKHLAIGDWFPEHLPVSQTGRIVALGFHQGIGLSNIILIRFSLLLKFGLFDVLLYSKAPFHTGYEPSLQGLVLNYASVSANIVSEHSMQGNSDGVEKVITTIWAM